MKIIKIAIATVVLSTLAFFSSPQRAIKANALILQGCEFTDVMFAQFEEMGGTSATKNYRATNTILCDRLTGTGHTHWTVHKLGFIYIPQWAGNC